MMIGSTMHWQPINTARHDLRDEVIVYVNVFGKSLVRNAFYDNFYDEPTGPYDQQAERRTGTPGWYSAEQTRLGSVEYKLMDPQPTHWMYMPKTPVPGA